MCEFLFYLSTGIFSLSVWFYARRFRIKIQTPSPEIRTVLLFPTQKKKKKNLIWNPKAPGRYRKYNGGHISTCVYIVCYEPLIALFTFSKQSREKLQMETFSVKINKKEMKIIFLNDCNQIQKKKKTINFFPLLFKKSIEAGNY